MAMTRGFIGAAAAIAAVAAMMSAPAHADASIFVQIAPAQRYHVAPSGYAQYGYTQPQYGYVQPQWGYQTYQPNNWSYSTYNYNGGWGTSQRRGGRDLDRDGIPNRYDRDRDGDGVPNRYDRAPNNRYRY
jgi:opacity protein-like surface antigen